VRWTLVVCSWFFWFFVVVLLAVGMQAAFAVVNKTLVRRLSVALLVTQVKHLRNIGLQEPTYYRVCISIGTCFCNSTVQRRRQDLFRGGAELEIRSWSNKSLTANFRGAAAAWWLNSFCDECSTDRMWGVDISQTTRYLAVSFMPTPEWTKNEIVESWGGHVPQCPIAGDATG